MNFFDHKDLGNHLLQLCPKVMKHPVYIFSKLLDLLRIFLLGSLGDIENIVLKNDSHTFLVFEELGAPRYARSPN